MNKKIVVSLIILVTSSLVQAYPREDTRAVINRVDGVPFRVRRGAMRQPGRLFRMRNNADMGDIIPAEGGIREYINVAPPVQNVHYEEARIHIHVSADLITDALEEKPFIQSIKDKYIDAPNR